MWKQTKMFNSNYKCFVKDEKGIHLMYLFIFSKIKILQYMQLFIEYSWLCTLADSAVQQNNSTT